MKRIQLGQWGKEICGPFWCRVVASIPLLTLVLIVSTIVMQKGPPLESFSSLALAPPLPPSSITSRVQDVDTFLVPPLRAAPREGEVVLVDMHAHTLHSDGDMSLAQLGAWERSQGVEAVVVTDHNTLTNVGEGGGGGEATGGDPILLPGIEYTTCRCHLNLVGVEDESGLLPTSPFPSDADLAALIAEVHARDGLVIVNHLPWSLHSLPLAGLPSRTQFADWGVDGFEVVNGAVTDWASLLFARSHNLSIVAGSDVHSPYSRMSGWTSVRVPPGNKTRNGILHALREGQTSVLIDPSLFGPRHLYPVVEGESWLESGMASMIWVAMGRFLTSFAYSYEQGQYDFAGGFCTPVVFRIHTTLIALALVWILSLAFALELCCLGCALVSWSSCPPHLRSDVPLLVAASTRCRIVPSCCHPRSQSVQTSSDGVPLLQAHTRRGGGSGNGDGDGDGVGDGGEDGDGSVCDLPLFSSSTVYSESFDDRDSF